MSTEWSLDVPYGRRRVCARMDSPLIVPARASSGEKLVARFLLDTQLSEGTRSTYTAALRRFHAWLMQNGIERPVPADLRRFRDDLRNELRPLSVGTYIIALRRFYRWLSEHGVSENIALGLKGARRPKGHLRSALSASDVRRLLDSPRETVRDHRDAALITLMVATGTREIEVARARCGDIVSRGGRQTLLVHGKGRDSHDAYVVLGERVITALREYFAARGGNRTHGEPLFPAHGNRNASGPLTTRSIRRIVTTRLAAAGLKAEDVTAHSLRHTAASLAIEGMRSSGGTADILAIKAMLRHARIDTTLLYSHEAERTANPAELYVERALDAPKP